MTNPFKTWTTVLCVVISLMWLSKESVADIISFGSGANSFNMPFVTIGNLGNAADTTGNPNPAGSVGYQYRMGKFGVSRDMITKYNTNFGTANSLAITMFDMTSFGGNGVNRPATGVSWNESARFVNWLNTSKGGFAAYNFTTGGVNTNITPWTAADVQDFDGSNPYRSLRANYVLPSMDEWYKAAYYDPNANGGMGGYWNFPTGSDTAPTAVSGGTTTGTAVYNDQAGPADIDNAGGLSPYGVMGMGGNVWEWEETDFFLNNSSGSSSRGFRGGSWGDNSGGLSSSTRFGFVPSNEFVGMGFRVASLSTAIPEPSSLMLTMFATVCGLLTRQRRRK